jgi:hypothetical protein
MEETMTVEKELMTNFLEPAWKKDLVETFFTILRVSRTFGKLYEDGGSLSLAAMEKLLIFLDETLGFREESSIPEDSIYFEMKKAQFNSLIKTDALVEYPCFFYCRFLHFKIEKFLFEIRLNLRNNSEMKVTKYTFFQFLKSLTQTEIRSID